jgi:hypothetical protein
LLLLQAYGKTDFNDLPRLRTIPFCEIKYQSNLQAFVKIYLDTNLFLKNALLEITLARKTAFFMAIIGP